MITLRWFGTGPAETFDVGPNQVICLYEIRDDGHNTLAGTSDREEAVKMLQRFSNKFQGRGFYIHEN